MSAVVKAVTDRRKSVWDQMKVLADRASGENRNFSGEEESTWRGLEAELGQLDQRLASLAEGEQRAADVEASFAALAGRPVERGGQPPSEADQRAVDEFRSMILERNPKPVDLVDAAPRSYFSPGVERRDLLKSAPANMQPVSFYSQIVEHMVESSAVLKAGATLVQTATGEDLRVPRSTALSTASIIAEGAVITESDPTLSVVTLGAFKYAIMIQVSSEMVADTTVDLQGYLARECGNAIGLGLGNHLINGTGAGQPRGVLADTVAGFTGPVGTATSLGTQGTAGQGTDLLNELAGSVAEPYAASPAAGYLLRNASLTKVRNLKTSAGDLVGNSYVAGSPWPFYVDPFVPAMAANAKSILFGDWSRYFVRMVNGIRFERSDEFAFNADLVSFRAILRADGALINTDAIKHFANSAT